MVADSANSAANNQKGGMRTGRSNGLGVERTRVQGLKK